jgi:hypothetical protein
MKTKDVLTWALILYALYKVVPDLLAGDGASSGACGYPGMTQTLSMPPWARQVGQQFTTEGEQ